MTKNELALELTKLCSSVVFGATPARSAEDYTKAITDTYNYIYENIKDA